MALVYNVNVRNSRLQQVINAIDAGAGNGQILLYTAGLGVLLSTVILAKPCATILNGVLTFSGTPIIDPAAAASGLAAAAQITDSGGTVVASGLTVGAVGSGANIIITLQNIVVGSIVTFQSGTITGN